MKWKLAGINEFTVSSNEIAILRIFQIYRIFDAQWRKKSKVFRIDCTIQCRGWPSKDGNTVPGCMVATVTHHAGVVALPIHP
jgi:hypothetical protein